MKIGSKVQKLSFSSDQPYGPILTVTFITDHRPIDGSYDKNVVVYLSDGTWSFIWNLYELEGE